MKLSNLPPREQIAETMHRIYSFGMTTTSGGNISIKDSDGSIWITPSAVDKGTLQAEDIVRVAPDGTVEGLHVPSSELPFHRAIYERRPDLRSVVHGHPHGLVAFSIARRVPDTRILPQARHVCGAVGYAPYELPGSEELGRGIADIFEGGADVVVLENHGTVVGGPDLGDAFAKFETLEFAARTILEAATLGEAESLSDEQLSLYEDHRQTLGEEDRSEPTSGELELRSQLYHLVRRAYRQRLVISTYGTFSARVGRESFLITPYGMDRYYIEREDLVLIRDGRRERGKTPSRSVQLHERIYAEHPEVRSIISAQSPSATAHAVTGQSIDTRTIPESYIVLRDIPLVPYGDQFGAGRETASRISAKTPIVMLQNDGILVTGGTLAETFDRLEVCEFSARSLIASKRIGEMVPMSEQDIAALNRRFFGAE